MSEFQKADRYLKHRHSKSDNIAAKEIAANARTSLHSSEIGSSFNEFKKNVMKLPEAEFIQHLENELKNKLFKRLESHYEFYSSNK
ncbi:MAG: hypothetical protein AABY22_07015 [Nanoarchaeota archaeon]